MRLPFFDVDTDGKFTVFRDIVYREFLFALAECGLRKLEFKLRRSTPKWRSIESGLKEKSQPRKDECDRITTVFFWD